MWHANILFSINSIPYAVLPTQKVVSQCIDNLRFGVGRAIEITTRPFRRRKEVYLFEVVTSTDQAFSPSFAPNSYSILSGTHAQRKSEAMSFYPTEICGGRTPAGLMRKLQVRGDEIGVPFAEAFCLARHFF